MSRVELLAPAGNFDCLKAAVNNGANAVYLGGKNFSARAFANNFDNEELREAVRYAHLRNVRIFVTLNTLLNEKEFDNAVKMADFYHENKVDALLVQDLGLYDHLKNKYPDFELHCSTQMHVHNVEGVKTAKKLGFKRVVLARESDLDLIREASSLGIETEVFVHGAICVSYSGQCLMSSATKHRSANKGMCAQCCRLQYELHEKNGKRVKTDTDYLLSPKDMFLLNDIGKLIEAGVSSFKIEGRMKSPAYVAYVTRMYRRAIDMALEGKRFIPDEQDIHDLKVLFNREFTNDLLYGRNGLFGQKTPNHQGVKIGEVLYQKNGKTYISLREKLSQFDGIRIGEFGCILNRLYKEGLLTNSVSPGEIAEIDCDEKVGGSVFKTLDHELETRLLSENALRIPLDLQVSIHEGHNVTVTMKSGRDEFTYVSDKIAQKALKMPLDEASVRKQFSRLNDTIYELSSFLCDTKDAFLPVSDLNQIRRNAIVAFDEYRLDSFRKEAVLPSYETKKVKPLDHVEGIRQENGRVFIGNDIYEMNYVINPHSEYPEGAYAVICEFGGLLKEYEHKIAYYTLNCCNSHTYEFLMRLGFESVVLSSELGENEIRDLIEGYENRNHVRIRPICFTRGDRVLMYLKSDPFQKYAEEGKDYFLSDRKNVYRIRKNKGIIELIQDDFSNDVDPDLIIPMNVSLD